MRSSILKGISFVLLCLSIIYYYRAKSDNTIKDEIEHNETKLYGVTIDSIKEIEPTIEALDSLSKKVMVRVVFDENISANSYRKPLQKLKRVSSVMGELFDSEYLPHYSFKSYKKRVDEYLNTLGDVVDVWEIGNEVNGEWTGKPSDVAKKIAYAYSAVKKRGYKSALTLYYNDYSYNDGCWAKPEEKMRPWVKKHLDKELKEGVEYLFISYYEEDCDNYRPTKLEWERLFKELGKIFPNSKLGFGEVGTSKPSKKADYLRRYYTLKINHPRYIGGYFWWYAKEDIVPKSKPLWGVLDEVLKR